MSVIDLKRKVFKFKLDEVEYSVNPPTVGQIKTLNEEMKEKGEDDINVTIDFLSKLGMPKDVVEGLEPSHLEVIIKTVTVKYEKKS